MIFDRIAILDWSAANRPRRGRDSVWLGLNGAPPVNPPTRAQAEGLLDALISDTLAKDQSLLIGADFAFGYPQGFAQAITGQSGALALWDWLERHLTDDAHNRSNRFELAAAINARLPGLGPFWFNASRAALPDLPHKGSTRHGTPFAEHRRADAQAKGAQSVWKLGGAGAVGSQALTGIPVLARLRHRHPGAVSVWPFEAPTTPVVLAEVFPSLLAPQVAARLSAGTIKDAVQVSLLADALATLNRHHRLAPLFATPDDPAIADEGWILGLGHEAALRASLL